MTTKNLLPFSGSVELINKLADDFVSFVDDSKKILSKCTYIITCKKESPLILRSARFAALQKAQEKPLIKVAFDTRRIDQEHDRNPRTNLQYWNRSQAFIEEEDQNKINIFSKLMLPLEEIRKDFETEPEYFNSYARVLHDSVNRILRVKEGDLDIFRPQLAYLEQLLFARYRLSMDEINKMGIKELKESILKKDENLLKRGAFLHATQDKSKQISKDGNVITQESIVNAIFGNNNIRRDGERTVERTITITIRDQILE